MGKDRRIRCLLFWVGVYCVFCSCGVFLWGFGFSCFFFLVGVIVELLKLGEEKELCFSELSFK